MARIFQTLGSLKVGMGHKADYFYSHTLKFIQDLKSAKNPLTEIPLQGNRTWIVQFVEREILREEMEHVFWNQPFILFLFFEF